MKKYKVWLHIEEIIEEKDHYQDLEEYTQSTGHEFDSKEEAIEMLIQLIDYAHV